jgi:hypothetical protein
MPLIELLIANDTEAKAVGSTNAPSRTFFGIEAKHIDPIKLAKLALILNGVPLDTTTVSSVVKSFAMLHEASDDGPWVCRVPDSLVADLASLSKERRTGIGTTWAGIREFELDGWEKTDVARFLDSLCELAGRAREQRKGLLMWMSL